MQKTYDLMVAPNGARMTKQDHANLPMSAKELADTARQAQNKGATGIHLHVRDAQGRHSLDPDRYQDAIDAVQAAAPGLEVQISTESMNIYDVADQLACLDQLRPKAASLSIREMARDPKLGRKAYSLAAETGMKLQHILYSTQDLHTLKNWIEEGVIKDTSLDVIFVLGQYSPQVQARPEDLIPFLTSALGSNYRWTVCAFGPAEQSCALAAIFLGGHARIGFENNVQAPDGRVVSDNACAVGNLVSAAKLSGYYPRSCRAQEGVFQ